MKRGLLVVPTVALALWLSAVTAAAAEWCSDDPAIHFRDAGGQTRTVYLTTLGDGFQHSHAVSAVAYTYGVEYGDHGRQTHLRLRLFVPDDSLHHFHVRWIVSSGPNATGTIFARHDGDSGHSADFDVAIAAGRA